MRLNHHHQPIVNRNPRATRTIEAARAQKSRHPPRKRKSPFDPEHFVSMVGTHIDIMLMLLDEQPEKFAAIIDHLRDDGRCIEALATLARDPNIQTVIGKIAAERT
jgi:hypothetical protein